MFDRANRPQFLASTTTITEMKTPFLFPSSLSLCLIYSLSLSFPLSRTHTYTYTHIHTLFLCRFHKRRRDIPPRRDRYGIIESSQFIYLRRVYMYVYIRLFVRRVYCLRVSCVCCMLLSVYDTFTIITIRCSSSTIRLNSRMYTFNIYIYI